MEFDIADNIPVGATITGVTLTVDDVRGLNGDQTVSLCQMLRGWGQGTSYFNGGQGAATNGDATWYYTVYNAASPSASPAWTVPGGWSGVNYSATVSASAMIYAGSANQSFSWSSTASPGMAADVQHWLDSPAMNFGWIMLGNESAGQTAECFGGQDAAATGETPPELTVQYLAPWTWTGGAGTDAWTKSGNRAPGSGSLAPARRSCWAVQATSGTVDLLAAAPSVSHLTFDANNTVKITSTAADGGLLTLDNGSGPVAVVVSGSGQAIDGTVAIVLDSDTWITTSGSADSLTIAGDISSGTAAYGIVKLGLGTLILEGSNTYSGRTTVDEGTLILAASSALPAGTSLTVDAGGTVIFDPALGVVIPAASRAALPVNSVPEPAALSLLLAGVCGAALSRRLARRSIFS